MLELARPGLEIGVVPHDVETMKRFYSDVLGLAPEPMEVPGGTLVRHHVGGGGVKLMCLEQPPATTEGGVGAAIGYRLITYMAPDLGSILSRVTETGLGEIDDSGRSEAFAFVADPDGNVFEMVGVPDVEPKLQVGLTVGDIDRSMGFYRDVLGFPEATTTMPNGRPRYSVDFGETNVKFFYRGDDLPVLTGPMTGRAGIRYLTATVPDLEAAADVLSGVGVEMPLPPTDAGVARLCIIADPDGNWIEVVEQP